MRRFAALIAWVSLCGSVSAQSVLPTTSASVATAVCIFTSGGRFLVGDRVFVKPATGGMQIRDTPDLNAPWTPPFQPPNAKGVVDCVQGSWLRIDFDSGVDGWARETGFDKVGGIIILPPPPPPPPPPGPIDPVLGASYYLSLDGNDANPGTLGQPFRTLQRAVPLLKASDLLVVRAGIYSTGGLIQAGGDTLFTTGESWDKPIRIHAAPGEKVTFVRDVAGPLTLEQVRAGVHAPTRGECQYYHDNFGPPSAYLPWPDNCWAGSPSAGYLWLFQDGTGQTTGPLIDLSNTQHQVAFLELKGIDLDGRGVNRNIFSTSTMANLEPTAKNIRILNAEISNAAASCFSQPGASDDDSHGVRNETNITVIDSKIHHCGIPFDPLRKNPWAKYLHGLYGHMGGWWCIRCEIYENAGGGWEPDGHRNGLIDSYIHDNSCLGAQVGGGDGHTVTGNVFYNNGCAEAQLLSGRGHTIRNNAFIAGPVNRDLALQTTFRDSLVADNIVTGFRTSIYSLQPWDKANVYLNNVIDGLHTIGNGTVPPVMSGMIVADPLISFDPVKGAYTLKPGSPAIGAASDGKNIGVNR